MADGASRLDNSLRRIRWRYLQLLEGIHYVSLTCLLFNRSWTLVGRLCNPAHLSLLIPSRHGSTFIFLHSPAVYYDSRTRFNILVHY